MKRDKTATERGWVNGEIVDFDERTWWGRVSYDLTTIPFHGTSYRGATTASLPRRGQKVAIVFNDAGRLLSVEGRQR